MSKKSDDRVGVAWPNHLAVLALVFLLSCRL